MSRSSAGVISAAANVIAESNMPGNALLRQAPSRYLAIEPTRLHARHRPTFRAWARPFAGGHSRTLMHSRAVPLLYVLGWTAQLAGGRDGAPRALLRRSNAVAIPGRHAVRGAAPCFVNTIRLHSLEQRV
jgi:hypothetical protein